jgi:inosine/xanthosine triphosphate pyrophosphatase family protein
MAELSAEDKNRLSHRARALSAILAALDGAA